MLTKRDSKNFYEVFHEISYMHANLLRIQHAKFVFQYVMK